MTSLSPIKKLTLFSILLVLSLYVWDIGNLDAIRQGTEGFYLQIAKEMFENNSILTPLYNGENHWSKPPLQFWMANIFYFFGGGPSIFLSRLVIVFFSISTIAIASHIVSKILAKPFLLIFVYISATLGMFKYSRIFMMEMPLTMLTTIGTLYFYQYLNNKKYAIHLASIFLGLSVLIKGPVSLVMAGGGIGVFLLIQWYMFGFKSSELKKALKCLCYSLAIASVWFIVCTIKYGHEFIDYFFLRENLGKFASKSYPIRHVFQGLIIFSLPWSLYLPTSIAQIKDHWTDIRNDRFLMFSNCCFFVFFTLWLIPSQRSHHYAMPSLIFFLISNFSLLNNYNLSDKRQKMMNLANYTIAGLMALTAALFSFLLVFKDVNSSTSLTIKVISTVCLLVIGAFLFVKSKKQISKYFIALFVIGNLWNIFIPSFILPYMPERVITLISTKEVSAAVRKPYFIEEALERKIHWIGGTKIRQYILENNHYYITHQATVERYNLKDLTNVVTTWKIWRRGVKAKDAINALSTRNIDQLKDTVYLLENKPLK
ncbi:ArnT family glycosyltransferase [Halobacteriovorax sp.]|uniref:ArnT family glycosyltransferase n=1 Tax=Halobacteriovorax sp. TaxID=2020862 RepID=UPI003564A3CF